MSETIAMFGGIYNNYLALKEVLEDAHRQGAKKIYCLGDLGGFGPHPDRVFPLLEEYDVQVIMGNYDHSIGNHLADCGCGYTDPRDNHYAQISYDYTLKNTSNDHKAWLRRLPDHIRLSFGGKRMLLVHGSPRQTNEFLWESTTPDAFLEKLLTRYDADILCCTHTGLHWQRRLPSGKMVVNVGAIGRPPNNGDTAVFYALFQADHPSNIDNDEDRNIASLKLETDMRSAATGHGHQHDENGEASDSVSCQFIPIRYDVQALAKDMREEQLPEEFVETIIGGWWTTCLENMPRNERARGKY